eukprot:ANDGO_06320.mRNA.1 Cyclin-dependent kinase D-1
MERRTHVSRYVVLSKIGEGSFGEVLKARDSETGEIVAMKRVFLRSKDEKSRHRASGELNALYKLTRLCCRNIAVLRDASFHARNLVLVMEFYPLTTADVIRNLDVRLSEANVKYLVRELLVALDGCHGNGVMHRDVKPANVLLSETSAVRLGDFGLATTALPEKRAHTPQVASRWYRAPELLFGATEYSFEVDIWGAGCIFAELLRRCPLFRGDSDIDQLRCILSTLGTPSDVRWPSAVNLPDFNKIIFEPMEPVPMSQILPAGTSADAVDLLQRMVALDPGARCSAFDALRHPFFWSEPYPQALSSAQLELLSLTAEERADRVFHGR